MPLKLAAMGVFKRDLSDVSRADLRWLKSLGVDGAGVHITCSPDEIDPSRVIEVRDMCTEFEIDLIQFWGPYRSVVSDDSDERAAGIREATRIIEFASDLGVEAAGIRPTSRSGSATPWAPDPRNHSPDSRHRFEDALHQLASVALKCGVPIVLEPHATSVLKDPETIVEIVEGVSQDLIKVNIDLVNFIHDVASAYQNSVLVERCIRLLGPFAHSVQIKDYVLDPMLVLHVSETVPGRGLLDIRSALKHIAPWPHLWIAVEHLARADIPEAINFLKAQGSDRSGLTD